MDDKKARDMMVKKDKQRQSYYNYYSSKKWGRADSYDLCINSSILGIDGTVKFIIQYIEDFELSTDDFAMVWSDSYTLSYVGTEEDGVAGLYIPIKAESVNTAKMAFEIPKDPEYLILYFIDYYYDNDGVMHEVADHYFTIPVTGF